MYKKLMFLFAIISTFLFGYTTFPTHDIIDADKNPRIDITGYKTYALMKSTSILIDLEGKWRPLYFDIEKKI